MPIRYLSGLSVDSTVLVVDAANDRVGIGTASPAYRLDVNGSISNNSAQNIIYASYDDVAALFQRVGTYGGVIRLGRSGVSQTTTIDYPADGTFAVSTAGSERMRITSAGNVGIGTTAPATKFHVHGYTTIDSVDVVATFSSDNTAKRVNIGYSTSGDYGFINAVHTGVAWKNLIFGVNGGNVGIGTTSPNAKLEVVGVGNFSNGFSGPSSETGYRLKFYDNGGIHNDAGIGLDGSAGGGEVMWFNALGGFYFGLGTGGTKVTISNAGNVGIGTTSPVTTLQVNATSPAIRLQETGSGGDKRLELSVNSSGVATIAANQSAQVLTFETVGSERMRIASTGATRLNAYGSGSFTGTVAYNLAVDSSGNIIETAGGVVDGSGTANYVSKWSDANTLTISQLFDNGTDVGIGTSSPFVKFDVRGEAMLLYRPAGNAYAIYSAANNTYSWQLGINNGSDFIITGGGFTGLGTERLRITSDGNVGIGTTSPSEKLDVYGAIKLSGQVANVVTNGIVHHTNGYVYFTGGTAGAAMGNDSYSSAIYAVDNGSLELYAGSSNRLHITSAGNVGIGTTTPITRLTIGAYSGSRLPYINGTANTFDANGITVTSSNTANAAIGGGIDLTNNVHSVGSFSPLISFSALSQSGTYNNNYAAIYGILAGDSGDGNWNSGHLVFATALAYGASEKMRITNAGNVGIGTTSPANKLVAVADATFNGENSYAIAAASSTDVAYKTVVGYDYANDVGVISAVRTGIQWKNLSILPVGNTNLGVGTLSPSQRLHVSGNIRVTGAYYDSSNSAGSSGQVLSSTGSGTDWVSLSEITGVDGTGTANYIAKWSDTDTITNSQVFDNGTNVGINNASPKTRLDINGAIGFGSKSMSMTDTFAAALTINMNDHNGCYVKITAFGDWSNHSTIAYLGEFFIQASAGSYNEPGIIIRQVDNTGGGDDIQAQIVDPAGTGTRDFVIQLKATSASNTPFTAYLQYEVRGLYNSVS